MKTQKIILSGLGNENSFSHYTFEKTQNAHKILSGLFKEVFDIEWPLIKEFYLGEKYKSVKTDVTKYVDFHEKIQEGIVSKKEGSRIDVFYGRNKMFFVIYSPRSKRNEFNKKIKNKIIMKTKK